MTHVMIDLETLDTKPSAAFISIGACVFDPETGKVGATFYMRVDWASAMKDRTTGADTLKWWMGQSDPARQEVLKDGESMEAMLQNFTLWVKENAPNCKPWGNGAGFDITMLEDAYRQYDIQEPWTFWNVRDVRTIVELAHGIVEREDVVRKGLYHHALDDALHQAAYVSKMWKVLRSM